VTQIRFLGIHSSPIKKGNSAYLLEYALGEAGKVEGVVTEGIALAGLKVVDCMHCNWCIKKQTTDRLCVIEDEASSILRKIRDCDVLLLVSPVYFGRLSGMMACLLDRTRCFIFGKEKHLALKGKVGIAMAVGWLRNGGIETTLESIRNGFLVHEMWTPSVHSVGAILGVGAVSGHKNSDLSSRAYHLGIMKDDQALKAARSLVQESIKTAMVIKNRRGVQ
jgi:multimeric flavodoxin WrbA